MPPTPEQIAARKAVLRKHIDAYRNTLASDNKNKFDVLPKLVHDIIYKYRYFATPDPDVFEKYTGEIVSGDVVKRDYDETMKSLSAEKHAYFARKSKERTLNMATTADVDKFLKKNDKAQPPAVAAAKAKQVVHTPPVFGYKTATASAKPASSKPPQDSKAPSVKPESVKPSTSKPESVKPQSSKPAVEPSSAKPQSVKPASSKPQSVQPSSARPVSAKPESVRPVEPAKIESVRPPTVKPESAKPQSAKPASALATPSAKPESVKPPSAIPSSAKPASVRPPSPEPEPAKAPSPAPVQEEEYEYTDDEEGNYDTYAQDAENELWSDEEGVEVIDDRTYEEPEPSIQQDEPTEPAAKQFEVPVEYRALTFPVQVENEAVYGSIQKTAKLAYKDPYTQSTFFVKSLVDKVTGQKSPVRVYKKYDSATAAWTKKQLQKWIDAHKNQ